MFEIKSYDLLLLMDFPFWTITLGLELREAQHTQTHLQIGPDHPAPHELRSLWRSCSQEQEILLSGAGSCSVRGLKGQRQVIYTEGWRSKHVTFLSTTLCPSTHPSASPFLPLLRTSLVDTPNSGASFHPERTILAAGSMLGDSPSESFYANQSSPPEDRAAPAFLLQMPASQIIPHFAGRHISQGRRRQQVLFCRPQQRTEQVFDGQ